jgi:hypothetical protein
VSVKPSGAIWVVVWGGRVEDGTGKQEPPNCWLLLKEKSWRLLCGPAAAAIKGLAGEGACLWSVRVAKVSLLPSQGSALNLKQGQRVGAMDPGRLGVQVRTAWTRRCP